MQVVHPFHHVLLGLVCNSWLGEVKESLAGSSRVGGCADLSSHAAGSSPAGGSCNLLLDQPAADASGDGSSPASGSSPALVHANGRRFLTCCWSSCATAGSERSRRRLDPRVQVIAHTSYHLLPDPRSQVVRATCRWISLQLMRVEMVHRLLRVPRQPLVHANGWRTLVVVHTFIACCWTLAGRRLAGSACS